MNLHTNMDSYTVLRTLAGALHARGVDSRGTPFTYACIGVQEGYCLRHVIQAGGSYLTKVELFDTWGYQHGGTGRGNHDHIDRLLQHEGYTGQVVYHDGESQLLLPKTPAERQWDLTYVDGSHERNAAFDDLRLMWPRTKVAMVVHDVRMAPVLDAVTCWLDRSALETPITTLWCNEGTGTMVVYR